MRALTIVLFLAAACAAAQATTIRVPADHSTIQSAIDAAYSGDEIVVSAGTYVENVDFKGKAVRLVSEMGPEYTIIRSAHADASTVVFTTSEPVGAELSGFTVTGGGLSGIRCQGSSPTITGNIITGNVCIDHFNGAGITMENTSNSIIRGNTFHGNNSLGYGGSVLFRHGSSDDEVSYNLMYDNVGYGEIRITEETYSLRIVNNMIHPTTYSGITHQGTGTMYLQNNIILNAPYMAVRDDSHAGTCQYTCTFNNNHGGVDFPYTVDATNFRSDPQFVNLSGRNFNLQMTSPCIDAGNPDPAYNDPDGTRNDIGALSAMQVLPMVPSVTLPGEQLSHVLNNVPVIAWSYYDSPASTQSEYEIEIGTDNDWSLAEMWAAGSVTGSELSTTYSGLPLDDGDTYFGRIRVSNGVAWGGWRVFTFHMNAQPSTPGLQAPVAGAPTNAAHTKLAVNSVSDPENDGISFHFQVYSDPGLVSLVDEVTHVAQTFGTTLSPDIQSLNVDTDYWWRARAFDGYDYSEWAEAATFHTFASVIRQVPEEFASIQEALAASGEGDQVLVGPGTYFGPITVSEPGITIKSSQGAGVTTITDNGARSGLLKLVTGSGAASVVSGFTFYASTGTSAVSIGGGTSAAIMECAFSENVATNGAGIFCEGTEVTISQCRFYRNQATSEGGGIYIRGSNVTVENCEFIDNIGSASGAAIYAQLSTNLTVRHNTAYGNSAGGMGGGFIYAYATTGVSLINNTIAGNSASDRGSGITLWGGTNHDIRNNIIAFNGTGTGVYVASTTAPAEYNDVYGNQRDYAGVTAGDGSISSDPLFVDQEFGDYSLQPVSPCIDAGDPAEQYNDPDGSRSDMGAKTSWANMPVPASLSIPGESPAHVLDANLSFAWQYHSTDGSSQYAYECQVGTDQLWDEAEMWATGEQMSGAQLIEYDGLPLLDGTTYFARVRVSDGTNWGDWRSISFHMNASPTVPAPISPIAGIQTAKAFLQLASGCATDLEGDNIAYYFEIFADETLLDLVTSRSSTNCSGGRVETGVIALELEGSYWWRVRSFDGYEYSAWSTAANFLAVSVVELRVPSQYPNLRAAIDASDDGTRILVAPGVYTGSQNRDLGLPGKLIEIVSEQGPETTVIDCENSGRAFYVNQGETDACLISGFTIRNGNTGAGGALRIEGAYITVRNCIFRNNQAPHGGAVYINSPTGIARFIDCQFFDNDARGDKKDLADGLGGAAYIQYGGRSVRFTGCLFAHNQADFGGALATDNSMSFLLTGCTVTENLAANAGAGMAGWGNSSIANSIFAFNHGYLGLAVGDAYNLSVTCTDIFGNDGGDWTGALSPLLGESGNMSADPAFCSPETGDYMLRVYSPCAAGNNTCQIQIGARGTTGCNITLPVAANIGFVAEDLKHIISTHPTIEWTYVDLPVSSQAAYEIEVGTDNDWGTVEMWASGQVTSAAGSSPYGGPALIDGTSYYLRVRVSNGVQWGSWLERSFRKNSEPAVPVLASPQNDQTVHFMNTLLRIVNAPDNEADTITYDFEVYRNAQLSDLLGAWTDVAEQIEQTTIGPIEGLQTSQSYWWRARAYDGYEYSAWSADLRFQTADRVILHVPSEYSTIRLAVAAAYPGDKVVIADGIYTGSGNKEIELGGKTITIESEHGAATTIIDCENDGRAFYIHQGEGVATTLKGLTLRNGNTAAGGGLRLEGASATVIDCVFERNVAPHGGAVYANTAGSGSSFTNCVFMDNSALGDKDDKADGHGGAVYVQYGLTFLTFNQCLFAENAADFGGAIIGGESSAFDLFNCTVVANASEPVSAAVHFGTISNQKLIQSIVAFNTGGCGVYIDCPSSTITCNDIFGNAGGDWIDCLVGRLNLNGNFSSDPRFCGFLSGNDDYRLRRRSLCLPEYNQCGALIGARGLGTECTDYLCGDVNDDELLSWSDVNYLKNFYFGSGPVPRIPSAGDPNCDDWIKLNDIIYLIDYFRGIGPEPNCCYDEKPDAQILPPVPIVQPKNDSLLERGAVDFPTE